MALATDKCVFLHIPKTGGIWVRHALNIAGIKYEEVGDQHECFPQLYDFKPAKFFEDRLIFAMVRHPVNWYPSRWAFRVKNGWQPRHPLDWNCASNDFAVFVKRVLEYAPYGWCTWLFKQYCEIDGKPIDFVGRAEFLVDDFLKVMRLAGHDIDEEIIRNTEIVNSSTVDGISSRQLAKFTPELYKRLIAAESGVINQYYFNCDLSVFAPY